MASPPASIQSLPPNENVAASKKRKVEMVEGMNLKTTSEAAAGAASGEIPAQTTGAGDSSICARNDSLLSLVPISEPECISALSKLGMRFPDRPSRSDFDIVRNTIILTLHDAELITTFGPGNRHGGVSDVNEPSPKPTPSNASSRLTELSSLAKKPLIKVRGASKYQDGSVASMVPLGRSPLTAIPSKKISRDLCDVSFCLPASCRNSKENRVCIVDLRDDGKDAEGSDILATDYLLSSQESSSSDPSMGNSVDAPKMPSTSLPSCASTANTENTKVKPKAWLSMRKAPKKHGVYLNGIPVSSPAGRQIPLENGQILSLYGFSLAYRIKIEYDRNAVRDGAEEKKAVVAAASTKVNENNPSKSECVSDDLCGPPSKKIKQNLAPFRSESTHVKQDEERRQRLRFAKRRMLDEITCPTCMDILVKASSAQPCGHSFCGDCVVNVIGDANGTTSCPTCRTPIQEWKRNGSLDAMVWCTAMRGDLGKDDAKHYLDRLVENGEEVNEVDRGLILSAAGSLCLDSPDVPKDCEEKQLRPLLLTSPPPFSTKINNAGGQNGSASLSVPSQSSLGGKTPEDAINLD